MTNQNNFSLVDTLIIILSDTSQLSNYSIKLNAECLTFLNFLVKSNLGALQNYQVLFTKLTIDKKVDSSDIPIILNLFKTVYATANSYKDYKITIGDIVSVTQFILNVITKSKGIDPQISSEIDNIIQGISEVINMSGLGKKEINMSMCSYLFSKCKCKCTK
jgi:hypothetical protein